MRVQLRRHVPGLLEERHVDHRRGVALRAGIAVPVPGAAESAALLHDADIADAGFGQPGGGHQAGESAADERDRHVIAPGGTLDPLGVRVAEVATELTLQLDVLIVAVGPQALGPLEGVPAAQRLVRCLSHSHDLRATDHSPQSSHSPGRAVNPLLGGYKS